MQDLISPASVLAHIDVGVAVQDRASTILFVNATAVALLGTTEQEMLGSSPFDPRWQAVTPDGRAVTPEEHPVPRAIQTGQPVRDTVLGFRKGSGERVWLQITAIPILNAAGAVDLVYATFTDVSRGQAHHDLLSSTLDQQRALLRSVTDAVPGVLYRHVIRADGTDIFTFVSAKAIEVLGIDPDAMRQSSQVLWDHVHPDDRSSVRAAIVSDAEVLRRAARAGVSHEQRFDEEFRIAMADGTWRWVRAQSVGTLVGDDMVCHGLVTDVTERRLLADQLRVSQRQELIGGLVSGIAHNFNNMLAAILPNLERASQTATGELRQEIADALDASKSAADLVRHLMLLVRRDEPRAAEPVDMVALVHDVMRMCRRTFDQRIALETTATPSPMIVLGHRSELQQVILNLCINARDAVDAATAPRIEVDVQPLPHAHVGVTVHDSGTGMTDEVQRRVGQPFFTTKASGKGTGLGVATALGIVSEMGGELTWTSRPGLGTTFRVSLPLAPVPRADGAAGSRAFRHRFAGQIVLVIDDEPLVRKTLARLLEGMGLTALMAATGAEGLQILETRADVALVLLDLSMPEMSGAEALSRIAALRPSLPVFVVSGWVADPEELGSARGVIQKPFTARELAEALETVLESEA